MTSVIGWDIGGVNTKVARVADGRVLAVLGRPYEIQRAPGALAPLLREMGVEIGAAAADTHAVTMTAELSQMFRTKRDGVTFVLDALEAAFPSSGIRVYAVDGAFLSPGEARLAPLSVAAANWSATAHVVARCHRDAVLIDVGTTTTDIIPIAGGAVTARGLTDPERLASGELVYTGVVRTPAEAIASHVPVRGRTTGVSAEGFALAGDVHLWRGQLDPADYTVPAPDGRPATREHAGERLARVVCADREMLDEGAVSCIADALAGAQVARIRSAIERVVARNPRLRTAVVTGVGAFLGDAAARAAGLDVVPLATELGAAAARCAPAASVALLLEPQVNPNHGEHRVHGDSVGSMRSLAPVAEPDRVGSVIPVASVVDGSGRIQPAQGAPRGGHYRGGLVETVVKLGGGVLADEVQFDAALAAIGRAARDRRLLVVPGGGPFADAVRDADRRITLSADAAHWMAILAMDQYAHVIAERLTDGVLVSDPGGIWRALAAGRLPVLAPARWLREADPLPHSWDVTSDSVAAWVAGFLGAQRLVLVKPAGATGGDLVDAYFDRALPAGVTSVIVPADQITVSWSG